MSSIPKHFWMFWDGPSKPDYVQRSTESWSRLHPTWEVTELTEVTMPQLRNQDLIDDISRVSPKSHYYQHLTNLLRLEVLHDHGGVWADADLEALRNIEPLIEGCTAFTARESRDYVNNGFIGCTPKHPYIAELLELTRDRVLTNPQWRSNRQTGAHHHTEVLQRHPDVRVLPQEQIYPVHWSELERRHDEHAEAWTLHHWNRRTQLETR